MLYVAVAVALAASACASTREPASEPTSEPSAASDAASEKEEPTTADAAVSSADGGDAGAAVPVQCQSDPNDPECTKCIKPSCCEPWAACLTSAKGTCRKYSLCIAACPDDASACPADCATEEPEGAKLTAALEACAASKCSTACE